MFIKTNAWNYREKTHLVSPMNKGLPQFRLLGKNHHNSHICILGGRAKCFKIITFGWMLRGREIHIYKMIRHDYIFTLTTNTNKSMPFLIRLSYCSLVAKSCLTLCSFLDSSLPGFSVLGISEERILELLFPSPGDLPDLTRVSCLADRFFTTEPPGKLFTTELLSTF